MPSDSELDWTQARMHILKTLERLEDSMSELHKNVDSLHREIFLLKFKSSLWGATAGTIPAVIVAIIVWMKSL
jgi:hypothetical protein